MYHLCSDWLEYFHEVCFPLSPHAHRGTPLRLQDIIYMPLCTATFPREDGGSLYLTIAFPDYVQFSHCPNCRLIIVFSEALGINCLIDPSNQIQAPFVRGQREEVKMQLPSLA